MRELYYFTVGERACAAAAVAGSNSLEEKYELAESGKNENQYVMTTVWYEIRMTEQRNCVDGMGVKI